MEVPAPDTDRVDAVTLVVVGITALALVARFVLLGDRMAHWDEARVAFWILDYMETGEFQYRAIIHGPFYHHVNPVLFETFGRTDATMRIAPALVGGLLPLTALLFRDRLRGIEITGVAFFLAANPLLLYYSRFMRGDLLVAAFMFAAFAFLVRAVDTGRGRHVVAAFFFAALGLTAKENALVYVLCWLGGLALLCYLHLYSARYRDTDWFRELVDAGRSVRNGLVRQAPSIAAGVAVFLVVIVFFFAPRSPDPGATAFNNLAANPLVLPGVIEEATVGAWQEFSGTWIGHGHQDHAYLPYLVHFVTTLGYGAIAVVALAFVGFIVESVARDEPRPVVQLAFFWGFASIFGYPIITDIQAPWATVHVVAPFVIPAATGLGCIIALGRDALDARDTVGIGLAFLVILLVSVPIGAGNATYVYMDPSSADNQLVQYAQPADDFHPAFDEVERVARANDGTDVLLYGNGPHPFVQGGTDIRQYPSCAGNKGWFNALPIPWYLHRSDADVTCIAGQTALDEYEGDPPVVIALQVNAQQQGSGSATTWVTPPELDERFAEYDVYTGKIRTTDMHTVIYVDPDRVPPAALAALGVSEATRIDDARTGDARTGDARTGDEWMDDARTGGARTAGATVEGSGPWTDRSIGVRGREAVGTSRDVYPGLA